jgi:hypothetical protein
MMVNTSRRADDHRHDGGHDGAAPPVVAQDPASIADEAVDVAAQRGVADPCDEAASETGAVLKQVVHDECAEDDAADQANQ